MFERMVHKMLQCDLSRAVGSWVNLILSLTLFPTFPHPEFLTSVRMIAFFFLFKKVTFSLNLLPWAPHVPQSCLCSKKVLSPELTSADPPLPGPKLHHAVWRSLVLLWGCPAGQGDGPSHDVLCRGPCHPQNPTPYISLFLFILSDVF